MKTTALRISFLALLAGFFASPAFAIDQVTLKSGQVYQGTVLNDVTNLYVDIRLVNGDTKRIQHSEVSNVERDVPSRLDRDQLGNQSTGFVSITGGGFYALEDYPGRKVLFDYGVKAGVISGQTSMGKIGFALSYDRTSQSVDGVDTTLGAFTETVAYNDLNLQMLVMRVADSGFYFGPNIGLFIATDSADFKSGFSLSDSRSKFQAGFGFGYEFFMADGFAIGPDVRYGHVFDGKSNMIKFALSGNFHF